MSDALSRRLSGAALILAPLLYFAAGRIAEGADGGVDWGDSRADRIGQLHAIADHAGRYELMTWLDILVPVLFLPAVLGLRRLTRDRAPVLSALGTAVGLVGVLGLAMHAVFSDLMHAVLADPAADPGQMAAVLERTEAYPPFVLMLVFVILGVDLGLLLLGIGLLRARTVPWWLAVPIVLYVAGDMIGGGGGLWGLALEALLLVGLAGAGVTLLREEPARVPAFA